MKLKKMDIPRSVIGFSCSMEFWFGSVLADYTVNIILVQGVEKFRLSFSGMGTYAGPYDAEDANGKI